MKKQSKVYEAAEGVENMPIKQTKMNHKKCTPGEFGAMVKDAANPVIAPAQPPAIGPHANRALKSMLPAHQKRLQSGQKAMDKIMGNPALNQPLGMKSAHEFGAYVKQSFNIQQYLPAIQKYLPAAGMGAGLGAGAGALSGLINPGEEDEYDNQGRVVGRRQRSRLGAMMRNALMGAGVGGVAGGVLGYASPATRYAVNATRAAADPVNYREIAEAAKGKPLPANMQIPSDMRRLYNTRRYGPDIASIVARSHNKNRGTTDRIAYGVQAAAPAAALASQRAGEHGPELPITSPSM
jgi:hypothetical protein